jgi:Uma2 family endonuclease
MLKPRTDAMSFEAYLSWEDAQDEKHELIDGVPVLKSLRMMAGGTGRHALIASRLIAAMTSRLRGGPCAPYGSDLKVRTARSVRYPDVTVDCSKDTAQATWAQDPRLVFEVLSPSNDTMAVTRLVADYQSMSSLAGIVLVSQHAPDAQVFTRDGEGWRSADYAGLDAVIPLPGMDVVLPLAEVYDGVAFEATA